MGWKIETTAIPITEKGKRQLFFFFHSWMLPFPLPPIDPRLEDSTRLKPSAPFY